MQAQLAAPHVLQRSDSGGLPGQRTLRQCSGRGAARSSSLQSRRQKAEWAGRGAIHSCIHHAYIDSFIAAPPRRPHRAVDVCRATPVSNEAHGAGNSSCLLALRDRHAHLLAACPAQAGAGLDLDVSGATLTGSEAPPAPAQPMLRQAAFITHQSSYIAPTLLQCTHAQKAHRRSRPLAAW